VLLWRTFLSTIGSEPFTGSVRSCRIWAAVRRGPGTADTRLVSDGAFPQVISRAAVHRGRGLVDAVGSARPDRFCELVDALDAEGAAVRWESICLAVLVASHASSSRYPLQQSAASPGDLRRQIERLGFVADAGTDRIIGVASELPPPTSLPMPGDSRESLFGGWLVAGAAVEDKLRRIGVGSRRQTYNGTCRRVRRYVRRSGHGLPKPGSTWR
jgi:hypothetical protein